MTIHKCFIGGEFSNKYKLAHEYAQTLTNEDYYNGVVKELKIYTSDTRNYVINIIQTSLITSYTFLNQISYDVQLIKKLIDQFSVLRVIETFYNVNLYRVLLIHNIHLLSNDALNVLRKKMQKQDIIVITTSKPKSLIQSLMLSYGDSTICMENDETKLTHQLQKLTIETETWKTKMHNMILNLIKKVPSASEFESIKINLLDLWVSNVTFQQFSRFIIKTLIEIKLPSNALSIVISKSAEIDHQMTKPHYHKIFYYTHLISFLIDTVHS
jgi:hypothetical protein